MEGKALEVLSTLLSLINNSESLGETLHDLLCPDTLCFKSLTYTEKQPVDHASILFPDDIIGDQHQGSGEVFCPPLNLSSKGIKHLILPGRFSNTTMKLLIILRKLIACR